MYVETEYNILIQAAQVLYWNDLGNGPFLWQLNDTLCFSEGVRLSKCNDSMLLKEAGLNNEYMPKT
jgi:hypothetical protein